MSEYIVELRNVTKRFPGIVANDQVTLGIKKGEILAILGENGAGKSTLMSMLFGMYEPDEGAIYVAGEEVKITSPNEATKLNIGMVHQHFKLVQEYTITQNIVLGIEPSKKKWGLFPYIDLKESNQKIASISKKYGLEVNPTDLIKDTTVSVQQRVEILKMLYRDAEILIFDEPTAVLTPQEITFLLEVIKNLQADGKTIIMITHKLEEIKTVADRCAIMCRGKLVAMCDVATTSTKEMARLMVGRDVAFNLDKVAGSYGKPVLEVEGLTVKDKNGYEVVKNVSFTIRAGEVFAIAGVSGNGQVEIADAIAGMLPTAQGTIKLLGSDITKWGVRERTEHGMAYIPEDRQTHGLVLDFTIGENAVLKQYYQKMYCDKGMLKKEKFDTYGNELIEKYDIRSGQGVQTTVRSMSGGNQQKIIVGREIELDTPFIIFVQPTRGLDVGAIERIHEQIIAERNKGKAILLISLELEEVMNCADTIGVIYSGEMTNIAEAKTLTTKEVGEYMMGVKA